MWVFRPQMAAPAGGPAAMRALRRVLRQGGFDARGFGSLDAHEPAVGDAGHEFIDDTDDDSNSEATHGLDGRIPFHGRLATADIRRGDVFVFPGGSKSEWLGERHVYCCCYRCCYRCCYNSCTPAR